jgi:hypothetical protein
LSCQHIPFHFFNSIAGVLVQAKEKITTLTHENETMTKELNELRSLKAHTSGGDQSRLDVEAQLAALRAEKDRQIEELNAEKERLQSQIEQLQNVRKQSFIRCTVF